MKRQMYRIVMGMLGLAALAIAPTAVQSGIVNGGFEDPGTAPGGFVDYPGGSTIGAGGWTVTGHDVLVLNTTYSEPGVTFNAHSGSNALDITGSGNTSPADGVFENVTTISGQSYTLSFYVGRADDGGTSGNYNTPSTVDLQIGGGPVGLFTNSNVTPHGVNYKLFSVNFTATLASTLIAFTNGTPTVANGGNNYAGLDDVALTAVPEPATFALAAAGLLPFVGVALRRARARRSA